MILGVVLLHLLLIPGVGFITGGARIGHQSLHPNEVQLNHSLLAIGYVYSSYKMSFRYLFYFSVLSLLVPAAFFAASNTGSNQSDLTSNGSIKNFLHMSHGMAILLLAVCVN